MWLLLKPVSPVLHTPKPLPVYWPTAALVPPDRVVPEEPELATNAVAVTVIAFTPAPIVWLNESVELLYPELPQGVEFSTCTPAIVQDVKSKFAVVALAGMAEIAATPNSAARMELFINLPPAQPGVGDVAAHSSAAEVQL
jgi:hypothetical protein